MTSRRIFVAAMIVFGIFVCSSQADIFDSLKKAKKDVEKAKKGIPGLEKKGQGQEGTEGADSDSVAAKGFAFSKKPIDPKDPKDLTTEFKAGDNIYGLIQLSEPIKKNWPTEGDVIIVNLFIDGEKKKGHTINVKDDEIRGRKWLRFEIAPKPEDCIAYADPKIFFGITGEYRRGPMLFTKQLSELKPGKHEIRLQMGRYGKDFAIGNFTIEGKDFKEYEKLFKQIKKVAEDGAQFPQAKMKNEEMEKKMRDLLKNAGWKDIHRLVIVDKDWWVQQGEFRYLSAAVMSKDDDGWYYKVCQFKQNATPTGYGPLEVWDQGSRRGLSEKTVAEMGD